MVTTAQKDELASNVTFCCDILLLTALDETVLGIAFTSRPLTISSVTYYPTAGEMSRPTLSADLEADTFDFTLPFEEVITREDYESGKWRGATAQRWMAS
jgi:hypothetical protein